MSEPDTTLADLPLAALLRPEVRTIVVASFEPVDVPFGTVMVRQGDTPDGLYVVLEGQARVVTRGDHGGEVTLATLQPGDTFGEVGLLRNTPATATVRAGTPVRVMRLDGRVFRALLENDERVRADVELRVRQLSLENLLQVRTRFGELPAAALRDLLAALEPVDVAADHVVVREGDPPGQLFVVEDGRLRARRLVDGEVRTVAYMRRGDVFGERGLFMDEPRAATVEAVTDARLLRLSAAGFRQLLGTHPTFRASVEELVTTYRQRAVPRVPLDFADDVEIAQPGAVDQDTSSGSTPTAAESGSGQETEVRDLSADAEVAVHDMSGRRLRGFPTVLQVDEADCGAACVAMVVRHFGRRVSLAWARQATHTTIEGTSMRGIARGAEALGLSARSVKASTRRLAELPLPAVCHDEGDHWVVVTGVDHRHVRVADPAFGRRRLPRAEFEQRWTGYAVLLAPTPRLLDISESDHPARWLVPFARRHWRTFALAALLALGVAGLEMLVPVFTQIVVDRVMPGSDVDLLRLLVLALAGVLVALAVGSYVNRYLLSRAAVDIDGETLDHVAGRMFALPLRYFQLRRAGDIQRRLVGLRQVRAFLVANGVLALTAAAQLIAALALMVGYSRLLTLVFLAAAPVYAGLMVFALRRIRPLSDNLEESFGRYHARQIDALRGVETVKAMGAEDALRRELTRDFRGLANRQFRHDLASMSYEISVRVVTLLSFGLFLWAGTLQVLADRLTIGEFVAFNTLVALATGAIRMLLLLWDDAQMASVLLTRIQDIFEQKPEQGDDHGDLRRVPTLSGHVRLRGVSFRYAPTDAEPILDDVDLELPAGTTVAIVGRSGSGKTTLARCIAGLLEPTSGRICFDGVDASSLDVRQLRRHIGFLPQDSFVFADSITNNIAFGEDEPDDARVRWAAKVANAHEFIARLPLGYETKVGETGLLLSGGQQQRIAIARAAYRRPAILVLDEATSNLDAESERLVQENLDHLLEAPTSLVIAHRLSTIRHADLIVVLERGRVVERGTHEELMERRGLYAYLTSQQLEV